MPKNTKPLIALPCGLAEHRHRSPTYQINQAYIESVLQADGMPVLLPTALPLENLGEMVENFDGFLLSGGGDVDPVYYNGLPQPNLHSLDADRDTFELALLPLILQQDKPLLTICRGTQVLNIALGGNLIEDIATQLPQAGKHDWYPDYDRDMLTHTVTINQGSRLTEIFGKSPIQTNSLHHQALDRLGKGLVVSGRAEDGVIEAVEMPNQKFVVGVQWHPECLPTHLPMRSLFSAFIQACQG